MFSLAVYQPGGTIMAKEELIEMEGKVTNVLRNQCYRVELDNGKEEIGRAHV